jgi:hypothetical protein
VATGRSPRLAALGCAVALAVAACASSAATPAPTGATGSGATGGSALASGLSANLDKLTSYRFTWSFYGNGTGAGPTAAQTGSFRISGTVVNSPTRSIAVSYGGMQYIQIGTSLWNSFDGTSWYPADTSGGSDLTAMLPTSDYATWFDENSTQFAAVGTERKNGVECVHFKGSDALGKLYGTASNVSASFGAELWVAKDGDYPVSGSFGFSAASGSATGSFGYQFDITNIDDPANKVEAPTNVIALPS